MSRSGQHWTSSKFYIAPVAEERWGPYMHIGRGALSWGNPWDV